MGVYKRGGVWWYKFRFAGRMIRESAKTESKTVARDAEKQRTRELEEGYNNIGDRRNERIQPISAIAKEYLADYKLKHRSGTFATYATGHVVRHLGKLLAVDTSPDVVRQYQVARLKEKASPKTINEEVGILLRLLGERGDAIRLALKREKSLRLKLRSSVGKAYTEAQKRDLLRAAVPERVAAIKAQSRSPFIRPALELAFNAGMRDAEIRNLTWAQIDFERRFLTVGHSKTEAGEGRTIPLNKRLFSALTDHSRWYTKRFGSIMADWYVFPARVGRPAAGKPRPLDPTLPVTSLKTAWKNVKERAGVTGRFHDTRHTLITELAETGAGDQTIMDITGHVSRQMLSRYSHIRMEAKRRALEAVGTKETCSEAAIQAVPTTNGENRLPPSFIVVGHETGHNPEVGRKVDCA
jgi:integrase